MYRPEPLMKPTQFEDYTQSATFRIFNNKWEVCDGLVCFFTLLICA